jgi:uncharacterized membrane protein YeaQ/YmgE (transglycosylase-associated protein family)
MTILMWILIGIVVGWLAGMIMGTGNGLIGDFVVGIAGAFIGGLIFARGNINNAPLTVSSFVVSLIGAVILLGGVNLLRRGGWYNWFDLNDPADTIRVQTDHIGGVCQ